MSILGYCLRLDTVYCDDGMDSSTLEGAGDIVVEKRFKDKCSNMAMHLTTRGRGAFNEYIGKMKRVMKQIVG